MRLPGGVPARSAVEGATLFGRRGDKSRAAGAGVRESVDDTKQIVTKFPGGTGIPSRAALDGSAQKADGLESRCAVVDLAAQSATVRCSKISGLMPATVLKGGIPARSAITEVSI